MKDKIKKFQPTPYYFLFTALLEVFQLQLLHNLERYSQSNYSNRHTRLARDAVACE